MAIALLGLLAVAGFVYLRSAEETGDPVPGTNLTEVELQTAYAELCLARNLSEGDQEQARDLFFGRVHSPLHEIARAAGEVDRGVAARLLEAKNDVETSLNENAPASETTEALSRLLPRTEQALRSVGVTTSTCRAS